VEQKGLPLPWHRLKQPDGEPEGRDRKFPVPWPVRLDETEYREWMGTRRIAAGDPAKAPLRPALPAAIGAKNKKEQKTACIS
jgi:hypothetical protein